jgi:hypothetical protein
MPVDDAPDIGQPDAGALEIRGPVEPLKHPEELVSVTRVETYPVVPHVNDVLGGA